MNCIYLNRNSVYTASPVGDGFGAISPTEEEKRKYCSSMDRFTQCPRLKLFQKHIAMINKGSYVANINTNTNTKCKQKRVDSKSRFERRFRISLCNS